MGFISRVRRFFSKNAINSNTSAKRLTLQTQNGIEEIVIEKRSRSQSRPRNRTIRRLTNQATQTVSQVEQESGPSFREVPVDCPSMTEKPGAAQDTQVDTMSCPTDITSHILYTDISSTVLPERKISLPCNDSTTFENDSSGQESSYMSQSHVYCEIEPIDSSTPIRRSKGQSSLVFMRNKSENAYLTPLFRKKRFAVHLQQDDEGHYYENINADQTTYVEIDESKKENLCLMTCHDTTPHEVPLSSIGAKIEEDPEEEEEESADLPRRQNSLTTDRKQRRRRGSRSHSVLTQFELERINPRLDRTRTKARRWGHMDRLNEVGNEKNIFNASYFEEEDILMDLSFVRPNRLHKNRETSVFPRSHRNLSVSNICSASRYLFMADSVQSLKEDDATNDSTSRMRDSVSRTVNECIQGDSIVGRRYTLRDLCSPSESFCSTPEPVDVDDSVMNVSSKLDETVSSMEGSYLL